MAERTLFEYYRRSPSLRTHEVVDVLPSYFVDEYPNLITFLEKYYDALERNGQLSSKVLDDLFGLKDVDEVALAYIDRIFYEIAEGLSSDQFSDPRLIGKLLPVLLREKGTLFAAENFFTLLYGIDAEISYPKEQLLTCNVSTIGPEGDILQNGQKWQELSVLVRSSIDFDTWKTLYKKLVHPAGYYLSAEVLWEGVASLTMTAPLVILDSDTDVNLEGVASFSSTALGHEALLTSESGIVYSASTNETLEKYEDVTLGSLEQNYDTLAEISQIQSPTFDEDSSGGNKATEFDVSTETFDAAQYLNTYDSDSA